MANVYTFPTYHLPGGDMVIVISIFDGTTASHSPTERYFTSIGKLVKETEFEGGELLCDSIKFEIEHDVSNLFSGTIYPSLVSGNRALMTITFSGSVVFIGALDVSSFNNDDWYSTDEALTTTKRTVKFSVRWILDVLKDYQMTMDINGADYALLRSQISTSLGDGYQFISLTKVITYLTYDIATNYGITVIIDSLVDQTGCLTQNFYDNNSSGSGEIAPYPSNLATAGTAFLDSAGVILGKLTSETSGTLVVGNRYTIDTHINTDNFTNVGALSNSPGTVFIATGTTPAVWTNGSQLIHQYTPLNYLFDSKLGPFNNKYSCLINLIQSFGWLLKISFIDASTIGITVSERKNGSPVSVYPNVLKNSNEDIFLEMKDSIDISSSVNNTEYKGFLTSNFSTFSFGCDFDLPASAYDATLLGQIMMPTISLNGKSYTNSTFNGVKYMFDPSSDYITNNEFLGNISGWTIVSGGWVYNGAVSYNPIGGNGSMKLPISSNDVFEIDWILASPVSFSAIFFLWLKLDSDPSDGQISIEMDFYNGGTLTSQTVFVFNNPTGMTDWRMLSSYFDLLTPFENQTGFSSFDRVKIKVFTNGISTPSFNMYFDNTSIFEAWNSVPKFLGRKIVKLFANGKHNKNVRTIDGIQPINLCDNYSYASDTYYVKKVEYDYVNNETNLEAINYQ